MKILVTGCAGFVGYHLCKRLLKNKDHKIYGVDNLNNYYSLGLKKLRLKKIRIKKNFFFYKIDKSNFKKLKSIFKKNKFDIIINLAAQAGVRYSISNPKAYFNSNISGFFNLAELSRIYGIKKIFYASSSSVYGEKKKFPLNEREIVNPKNIYSLSKKNNEDVAQIYSNYYNINFVGLRLFTIYGDWGRPDMLIIKYITAAVKNKKFYLNNYGKHFRDFTHINDVVNNILILMKKNFKKKHMIFNICSNNPVSLKFILKLLDKEFGKPKIIKRTKQLADVYKTHGDNKKLISVTKYKNFVDIKVGLIEVINWAKENINFLKKN